MMKIIPQHTTDINERETELARELLQAGAQLKRANTVYDRETAGPVDTWNIYRAKRARLNLEHARARSGEALDRLIRATGSVRRALMVVMAVDSAETDRLTEAVTAQFSDMSELSDRSGGR